MRFSDELLPVDRESKTPVYLQIANGLIRAIQQGRLRGGAKLPGTEKLSSAIGINRKTLQTAYDELMAQGWIEIFPRKGAFVAAKLPETGSSGQDGAHEPRAYRRMTSFRFDEKPADSFPPLPPRDSRNLVLDGGFPDVRTAPIAELIREYRTLSRRTSFATYLGYGHPMGARYLRETLAEFLRETRGLPVSEENLLITRGAQMAFFLATRLLVKPGDHVALGFPGYVIVERLMRQAGAVVDRIPVDEKGLDIDRLEALCRKTRMRMVYVMPHHHVPTTATLSPERRLRLVDLAERHGFAILEDDYDYDFEYDSNPFLPIASLDGHGGTIYVGTLTKTLFPAMRLGFLAAPVAFIRSAAGLRSSIDLQGDSMMEVATAELYRNGTMRRFIRRAVKLYRERRDSFCSLLEGEFGARVRFAVPSGGLAVWARFAGTDLIRVARIAEERGLTLGNRMLFDPRGQHREATRLGFASLETAEQERAIAILKDSIDALKR